MCDDRATERGNAVVLLCCVVLLFLVLFGEQYEPSKAPAGVGRVYAKECRIHWLPAGFTGYRRVLPA
jgi:hypothetical protein